MGVFINKGDETFTAMGSFDAIASYINKNYDGLKDDVIKMLGRGGMKVEPTAFSTDFPYIRIIYDVLSIFINLGCLAYDSREQECSIPN